MSHTKWKLHKDPFKKDKPIKYVYPDQKQAKKEFIQFIRPYLKAHKFFKRVWIWGSLQRGTFGVYKKLYRGQEGSDVDLLVKVNEKYRIPSIFHEIKDWTKKRTYSRAFVSNLCFHRSLPSGKKIAHKIDFICHFPSKHTKPKFYSKVRESKLVFKC